MEKLAPDAACWPQSPGVELKQQIKQGTTMTASTKIEVPRRRRTAEERRVALVVHRFVALNPEYRRRLASCEPAKWSEGIAALNRAILRLALGEETSPLIRRLLVRALSRGELQLVPERVRRGHPGANNPKRDAQVAKFIRKQIHKHPERQRKAIYADAQKRFGLGRTQILEIWAKANRVRPNRE
jgi:hypothetical protein